MTEFGVQGRGAGEYPELNRRGMDDKHEPNRR
jgi:hypothetical protein